MLLLVAGSVARAAPPTPEAIRTALYSYDRALALNATVKPLATKEAQLAELRERFSVSFDSVHDQRVTAIYTRPRAAKSPCAAVILLHGSGGNKDTDYVRLSSDTLSRLGYATLSIDSQYHGDRTKPGRSGDIHFIQSDTNRDAWMQSVVDLRRAVDFLVSRTTEVDGSRIGYLGFSQGGMIGATFVGVESRVKAACLAVAGGGFVEWSKVAKLWTDQDASKLEVNAWMVDPIYFVGGFAGRPLLFLNARQDELIAPSASAALHKAAGEPKEIKWYMSGHVIPPTAILVDARAFFAKHLGGPSGKP